MGVAIVSNTHRTQVGGAVNDGIAIFSGALNAPFKLVSNTGGYIASIFTSAKRVRELEAQNSALLEWRDEAKALKMRLQDFERLSNIKSDTISQGKIARFISEIGGPFSRTGIVNVGSDDGIVADWIVINQYGLVGRVISVGKNSSRVLMLTDSASHIAVMGENTRARAIVSGDNTEAPLLAEFNTPGTMQKGERLVTSGDDGVVPRGIAVGYAGIAPADKKWRVKLSYNAGAIDYVKLIPPMAIKAPGAVLTMPQDMMPSSSQVLPLNEGAGQIPTELTPKAIAKAQITGKKVPDATAVVGNSINAAGVAKANSAHEAKLNSATASNALNKATEKTASNSIQIPASTNAVSVNVEKNNTQNTQVKPTNSGQ